MYLQVYVLSQFHISEYGKLKYTKLLNSNISDPIKFIHLGPASYKGDTDFNVPNTQSNPSKNIKHVDTLFRRCRLNPPPKVVKNSEQAPRESSAKWNLHL